MFARAAMMAVLHILIGFGFAHGAERNVAGAYRQSVVGDIFLEHRNIWETYGKDLCCVKYLPLDLVHICCNDANTQLVSCKIRIFRGRYFYGAPLSAPMNLRRGEAIVKRVVARLPFMRLTGFRRTYCIANYGFKPHIDISDVLEIYPGYPVDHILSDSLSDVCSSQLNKETQSIFVRIWCFDGTVEGGFDRNPRAEVALGDILCVSKGFGAFGDGAFSSLRADVRSFGSFSSIVESANYKDYSQDANQTGHTGQKNLIFGRYSSAPGYAKIGLMAVLGWLASTLINESGIRGYHNRWQGELWFALGMVCLGLGIFAALLLA